MTPKKKKGRAGYRVSKSLTREGGRWSIKGTIIRLKDGAIWDEKKKKWLKG